MGKNSKKSLTENELLYQLDGKPSFGVAFPLGLQHVLAMFTGNLAPVLILIGVLGLPEEQSLNMIQAAMLVSGLTTFIQLYPFKFGRISIGAGLPIVMGTSFAFVPIASSVGAEYGLAGVMGAAFIGSIVSIILGLFFKPLKRFFPPLVIGAVLITIGLDLLDVGVDYFAGGATAPDKGSTENLTLGFTVFAVIMGLQRFGRGMWKISAILIGLVVGYLIAIPMGKVDFSGIAEASWIGFPIPEVMPWEMTFHFDAILGFIAIYIVVCLETIGNANGITIAGFNREATGKETSGAILGDAIGCVTASLFNTLPNTAFGQNAGIVSMTKIVNKWCIAMGAFVLIGAAIVPKVGAVFNSMPSSVLGGAIITVFAMIMINGIKMIAKAGFSERNVLVLAITFGIGLGLGSAPEVMASLPPYIEFIFKDTIACVTIVAIIANIIFPESKKEKEAQAALHQAG